jgi:hypothetical protein
VRHFILHHGKRHQEIGGPEIDAFWTCLAVAGHLAASTSEVGTIQFFEALAADHSPKPLDAHLKPSGGFDLATPVTPTCVERKKSE